MTCSPSRLLVGSNASDAAGRFSAGFLLPVMAVVLLGGTASTVGVLNAVQTAAFLLLGIPVGLLVDRLSTRVVLLASLGSKVVAAIMLLVLNLIDSLSIPVVFAAAALLGVGAVLSETAQTAATVRVAGKEGVAALYARLQSADSSASIVTPGVVGLLFGLTPAAALALTAAAFVVALALAAPLNLPPAQRDSTPDPGDQQKAADEHKPKFLDELVVGIRETARNRELRALTLITMLGNAGLAIGSTVEIIYLLDTLGMGADYVGLRTGLGGAGALLGSVVAPLLMKHVSWVRLLVVASAFQVGLAAAVPLAAALPSPWTGILLVAQAVVWGLTMVCANVVMAGWSAAIVSADVLGRAAAAGRTFAMGVVPIASIAGGVLAAHLGVFPVLWVWVALAAIGSVMTWVLLMRTKGVDGSESVG